MKATSFLCCFLLFLFFESYEQVAHGFVLVGNELKMLANGATFGGGAVAYHHVGRIRVFACQFLHFLKRFRLYHAVYRLGRHLLVEEIFFAFQFLVGRQVGDGALDEKGGEESA